MLKHSSCYLVLNAGSLSPFDELLVKPFVRFGFLFQGQKWVRFKVRKVLMLFSLGMSLTCFMSKKCIAAATIWASRTRLKKLCAAAKSFLTTCGIMVRLMRLASCFSVPLSLNDAVLYRWFHITYTRTQQTDVITDVRAAVEIDRISL